MAMYRGIWVNIEIFTVATYASVWNGKADTAWDSKF